VKIPRIGDASPWRLVSDSSTTGGLDPENSDSGILYDNRSIVLQRSAALSKAVKGLFVMVGHRNLDSVSDIYPKCIRSPERAFRSMDAVLGNLDSMTVMIGRNI
jgi:hypothetical protein